ncbi:ABC transporter ATP-binding protein [Pseudomonas protegens]|uniref:ABC transporter ATP-binding protein n=1 Tax=Pseudomonas protegens TaxID=380021 RepID=UPI00274C3174|nr:ABC transporter ATP-binding protein [Pseudomonas protegens]MDP9530033.1 ABC transporter ATP-binding protein [Pseudomonas protegens]
MSSDYIIEARDLTKDYNIYRNPKDRFLEVFKLGRLSKVEKFTALKGINIKIKKGESIGIVGKNGAGKSTLLQIISGIIPPSSGSLEVHGRVSALLELGAGFNPEFTGRENVFLNATIYGIDLENHPSKLQEIIEFSGIGDFIDQPVRTYSSGMYVRLAFAISSQMKPDILIVDEALSVGDIQFQSKCLKLIAKLRADGCTFIFVSHSPRMIELFCDRAVWIDRGIIREDGEPRKVVRRFENYMVGGLEAESETVTVFGDNIESASASASASASNEKWISIDRDRHVEGSNMYRFEALSIKADDQVNPVILTGEINSLVVSVKVAVDEDVLKPLFGIGIFNDLNQPIIHFNSDNLDMNFPMLSKGSSFITFSFNLPKIRAGDYLLALGLDSGVPGNSTVLTHVYDAWKFRCTDDSPSPQAGYISLENTTITVGEI